jgi:phage tail-like protein
MKHTDIANLLPRLFQESLGPNTPLSALLQVMEHLHEPSETILAKLDSYFDPYRTPDAFVPFLANWVDLQTLFDQRPGLGNTEMSTPLSLGRMRELIASRVAQVRWQGTRQGLVLFLEIATGVTGFEVNEQILNEAGEPMPFHVRVIAPETLRPQAALLERMIELEKPAHVTYDLVFQSSPS